MSVNNAEKSEKTPAEMLAAYQANHRRFSQGWQQYIKSLEQQFANGQDALPVAQSTDTDRIDPARSPRGWWLKYSQFIKQRPINSREVSPIDHAKYQIERLADAAHVTFTPWQQHLYRHLLKAPRLESDGTDNTGISPRGLSDSRLMIEICLLTGDEAKAQALIAQYPSTLF